MLSKREPDGVNGSIPRLREAQEEPTLCSKTLVPDPVQEIHSVQDASQIANTSVLTAEKKKLQKLWLLRESNLAHKTALAQKTCLPAIAPDTIRRAAREFSTHTATSTNGFAMRHFALLSDDALMLVSQLFECVEMLGTIPQQLRYVLVVLIPKATTVLRPTGNFCALCRLWAKCPTAMAQSWENLNPRPYFAASKGRAVTDPIWRHAVAVECGVGQGEETVSVWRDFAQFYKCMEHHILQANAETFLLPVTCPSSCRFSLQNATCVGTSWRGSPLDTPRGEW